MQLSKVEWKIINLLSGHRHGLRAEKIAEKIGYTERYTRRILLLKLIRSGLIIRVRHREFTYYGLRRKKMIMINKKGEQIEIDPQLPFDNIHNKKLVVLFEELCRELKGLPMYALESEVDEKRIEYWRTSILSVLGMPRKRYSNLPKKKKEEMSNDKQKHVLFLREMRSLIHELWSTHCEFRFVFDITEDHKKRTALYNKKYNDIAEASLARIKYLRGISTSINPDDLEASRELFRWVIENFDRWENFHKKISTIQAFGTYYQEILNTLLSNIKNGGNTSSGTRANVHSTLQEILNG